MPACHVNRNQMQKHLIEAAQLREQQLQPGGKESNSAKVCSHHGGDAPGREGQSNYLWGWCVCTVYVAKVSLCDVSHPGQRSQDLPKTTWSIGGRPKRSLSVSVGGGVVEWFLAP